jgi:PmbA protein
MANNKANKDYKELAAKLVKQCIAKGADAAEVYIEKERNLGIRVLNGETESIQESASQGIGFRVFVKGKVAFSHSNDFSETSLENAINSAVTFAGNTTADKHNILPDDKGVSDVKGLYDPDLSGISIEKKLDMALKLEKLAMKDDRITKSAGSRFSEGESDVFLANSHGLKKSYKSSFCSMGVQVVAEKDEQKSSGSDYCTRRHFSQLKSVEEIAAEAAKNAYEMLDPKMIKTQKAPVIFHPDVARSILGGILGAIDGERVLQGASFLANKLNQKFASELVTLIDDGTLESGINSAPFDGEGVPVQKRLVVEKGVLKGYMYNTIIASRAGVKSTGNASRRGFNSLPGIGSHNFYMAAGTLSPEEIIKNTKKGLLVKGVTGYGINPVNGNFSGGATGFWIEDGKIQFPVKGITIAGTADEILNAIDMVGTDLDLNKGFTAPSFRVKELQIGGE